LFYDPRKFTTISRAYWQTHGPAAGRSLHHWLIPQKWTAVPQGIRNAGFNLLELPKVLPGRLSLNSWMGFAIRWNNWQSIAALTVENGIKVLIPVSVSTGGYVGYRAGKFADKALEDEVIDLGNGAKAVPLDLDRHDVIEMQDAILSDFEDDPALR